MSIDISALNILDYAIIIIAQFFNSLDFNQLKIENNTAETHVYRGLKITPIQSIWDAE